MGICYTLIMQDEFNWGYVNTSREKRLEEFCVEFEKLRGYRPEKVGEWYGAVVYDIEKASPYLEEYTELILKYCDFAHYISDQTPWEIVRLKK